MNYIENKPALKPFVKWAGGKRQLLPQIRKYLPPDIADRVYFEPFAGAGALFFDLVPKKAVINDINGELMLAYRVIKNNPGELIKSLLEHEKNHSREYFYKIRAMPETSLNDVEKASRFIFLNRTCYNGLYRVNSQGLFNVPAGRYKKPNICDKTLLLAASEFFNSSDIVFLNTDFEEAVLGADTGSFVYFDPPYHSLLKTGFNAYMAGGFGESEQIRLRDLFSDLTKKRVPCLLSSADTPFIRELYNNPLIWINNVTARRTINSDQGGRGMVNELLVGNYDLKVNVI